MTVLWLRFLTEIDTNTEQVPTELKENPEIQKALEELKVTGFTEEELRAYEKLLDNIRVERTLQQDSYEKGVEEGMEKGIEQGVEIGLTKGQNKEKFTIAQKCYQQNCLTPNHSFHRTDRRATKGDSR